jgi:hypothetical protein
MFKEAVHPAHGEKLIISVTSTSVPNYWGKMAMKSRADALVKSKFSSKLLTPLLIVLAGAAISSIGFARIALGDTLELKTGEIVQGKFIGGSPLNIRFEVDGKEQIFKTKDVLNLGFSDLGDGSSAPAPTATPAPSSDSAAPTPAPPPADAPAASAPPPATAPPPAATETPNPPVADSTDQQAAPQGEQQNPQQSAPQTTQPGAQQAVTIPSGTSLLIRMIDSVDSSTNLVSDPFHASLEGELVVGNTVVAPKGADVYGMLARAKEAGKISGSSELTLELTGIRINGNVVPIDSTTYDVAGKSRGGQSAARIGGGAVAGAVVGGIIGGGKGAAIGATLGAGAGATVQVMTHGETVRIPSETLLEFTTEHDVMVPALNPSN